VPLTYPKQRVNFSIVAENNVFFQCILQSQSSESSIFPVLFGALG
jgi:hypothetical protein